MSCTVPQFATCFRQVAKVMADRENPYRDNLRIVLIRFRNSCFFILRNREQGTARRENKYPSVLNMPKVVHRSTYRTLAPDRGTSPRNQLLSEVIR